MVVLVTEFYASLMAYTEVIIETIRQLPKWNFKMTGGIMIIALHGLPGGVSLFQRQYKPLFKWYRGTHHAWPDTQEESSLKNPLCADRLTLALLIAGTVIASSRNLS